MSASGHRRRVLMLSPFAPRHDSAYGTARLIAEEIEALATHHDLALLCLRAAGDPPADERVRDACGVVHEVVRSATAPSLAGRIGRVLRPLRALATGTPLWVANWTEPELARRVAMVAREWCPDVVQLEFHVMGRYAEELAGEQCARVLVVHEPGHAAALERRQRARGAARWARTLDARAWQRFERTLLGRMDAVVAFTDADVRRLAAVSSCPVVPIRPGIHIPARALDPIGRAREVLFVGNFTHPPNLDAALRLATTLHPRWRARVADAELTIVGDHAPPELRALASEHVAVTGRVPDLVPFLDRAAVFVAPLRLGGGIRVKILEALAAGKAIVASPRALEGLGVVGSQHCLVADRDDDVVAAVATLLEDPTLRARIATAARAWATAHLGWDRAVAAYDALYDRLLDGRRRGDAVASGDAWRAQRCSAGGTAPA